METNDMYCLKQNQARGYCFKYNKENSRQIHREHFIFNRSTNYWNE